MDEKSLFTDFWTNESKTTRNVLARIPEGSDYRPDPKSRTAQEIAWQIVCEEKMIIDALESGKAEWAPPPMPATMKEVLEAYEKQSAEMANRWEALADDRWDGTLEFFGSSAPRRRWRGAFSSTSCTTAARSPPTCGRWDRRCRRSTGRAATSRRLAAPVAPNPKIQAPNPNHFQPPNPNRDCLGADLGELREWAWNAFGEVGTWYWKSGIWEWGLGFGICEYWDLKHCVLDERR